MNSDTINDDKTIAGDGGGTILAGRYRIVRQLGQGGMGSVWLAEPNFFARPCMFPWYNSEP